ncbi:unnamed protein product [Didymodactylos carnosus]|uniref:NAD(P)(+)--arginine ADP-ribosyltransferase n=1 Tax=Didymodactylos carnosus TaxID=1234261 RepID=A0A8S2EF62_9BILA|nr:unnamed protein product [Didymodactylos carnosus]CAF4018294.1 unnamed protein product [Didymodactylos carnosus]
MSVEGINCLESNDSTGLCASSSRGHEELVELQSKDGVVVRSLKNKRDLTAYNKTKNNQFRQLFRRQNAAERFISLDGFRIEWMRNDCYIEQKAAWLIYSKNARRTTEPMSVYVSIIKAWYLDNHHISNIRDTELIRWFFNKASEEEDPIQLIKIYTRETSYYRKLNEYLAIEHTNGWNNDNINRQSILSLMRFHSSLQQFSFIGVTYRGMRVTETDLEQYAVGTCLMNKAFLSTSKDRRVAEAFADSCGSIDGRLTAICVYEICLDTYRSAIDIETISEFQDEQEVLIHPLCVFEVFNVSCTRNYIEIQLKECNLDKAKQMQ